MAAPLTETPTFDATVNVPEDGVDDETAASLVPAFQSLADRSQWLKAMWTTLLSAFSSDDDDDHDPLATLAADEDDAGPRTPESKLLQAQTLNILDGEIKK